MNGGRTLKEFDAVVRQELAQVGIEAAQLEILTGDSTLWWIKIEVAGRRFSIGCVHRDGFFCEETTEGRKIDFTAHVGQTIFGHEDHLRFAGLKWVRYALDHPEFRGYVRPVI